jgi:hypothetical protein
VLTGDLDGIGFAFPPAVPHEAENDEADYEKRDEPEDGDGDHPEAIDRLNVLGGWAQRGEDIHGGQPPVRERREVGYEKRCEAPAVLPSRPDAGSECFPFMSNLNRIA